MGKAWVIIKALTIQKGGGPRVIELWPIVEGDNRTVTEQDTKP